MVFFFVFLITPVFVYVLRALLSEYTSQTKIGKCATMIFIISLVLLALFIASENFNYYIFGAGSTLIVYFLATLAAIVYTLSDRRPILNSFKRITLNLASIALMLCLGPFLLLIPSNNTVYSDSNFHLTSSRTGIISRCGLPILYVKYGILEMKCKMLSSDTCVDESEITSVSIIDEGASILVTYLITESSENDSIVYFPARYSKP